MRNDIVFTNLEVVINKGEYHCDSLKKGIYRHEAPPQVLDYLKTINVNLLSLSNNHSFDFGECGIESTIDEVSSRNFFYAGTGRTLSEASDPEYFEIKGVKIAFISMTSTGDNEKRSSLTPLSPCVNFVDVNDSLDRERVFLSIEKANKSKAEIILIYHHWHEKDEAKTQWAHELLDKGADMFISHGYPEMGGIEIYKNKPIFYNLKNFIFQTKTEIGHYGNETWENVFITLKYNNGVFSGLNIYPIVLNEGKVGEYFVAKRGYPEIAPPQKAIEILNNLQELSRQYKTTININDNIGIISLESTHNKF